MWYRWLQTSDNRAAMKRHMLPNTSNTIDPPGVIYCRSKWRPALTTSDKRVSQEKKRG
jgi:hypothetical protein